MDYMSVKYIVTQVRKQRGDPGRVSRVNPEDYIGSQAVPGKNDRAPLVPRRYGVAPGDARKI